MALLNLVRVTCATLGTGTLTLGDPVEGFLSVALAGGVNSTVYSYGIEADYVDGVATSREVGTGTWSSGGNTLTRTVINSTNSDNPLNLSGDARVIITDLAEDHLMPADIADFVTQDDIETFAMVKLAEGTVTGDPLFVTIQLPTGYRNFCLNINGMISNSTSADYLYVQLSSDGGATVRNAANSYRYYVDGGFMVDAETFFGEAEDGYTGFYVTGSIPYDTVATLYGSDFKLWIHEPRQARATTMQVLGVSRWSHSTVRGGAHSELAAVDNAVQISAFNADGISNMRYTLYGEP